MVGLMTMVDHGRWWYYVDDHDSSWTTYWSWKHGRPRPGFCLVRWAMSMFVFCFCIVQVVFWRCHSYEQSYWNLLKKRSSYWNSGGCPPDRERGLTAPRVWSGKLAYLILFDVYFLSWYITPWDTFQPHIHFIMQRWCAHSGHVHILY